MRRDEHLIRLVRDAAAAKIPMAAICHGPWMLCSTDALRNRRCTSFFAIARSGNHGPAVGFVKRLNKSGR